jgi:hypothetical protein
MTMAMTITIPTFDADTIAEMAARARKSMRAAAFVAVLLACFCFPTLWCPAAAAPFQQYQNAICGSGECVIGFEAPPIGKRLELHDSSCYLRMRGANELRGMWLYLSAGEFLVALAPEATIREGESDQTVYAANHSIFAYARAGVQFLALVQWTRGVAEQFACHISGEMLDEPG